jgi:uncharacterized protein (TIGR02246 family)
MKQIRWRVMLMTLVLAPTVGALANGAEEENIQGMVEAYVAAFNEGDAESLADLWSPEAIYSDPITGDRIVGREAIRERFARIFSENEGAKLEVSSSSVQVISPSVAIERGTASVVYSDAETEQSDYTAVYVKRDGQWLLDRVSEEDIPGVASSHSRLKDLDWMTGKWVDQDDEATVVTECHWAANKSFLVRTFTVQIRDRVDMSGIQIVGWDPVSNAIRSWVFDSGGGFGVGTWSKKGNRWYVQQEGVLADGRTSSSVNVITRVDDDTCMVGTVNRSVDGELLPNIDEVRIAKE